MTAGSHSLDDVDRQILHALNISPRAPFARIATVIGVSEHTVARRYQKMRSSGVIRVLARTDSIAMPSSTAWMLRIGCRPGTAGQLAKALASRNDTSWISIGAGGAEITCLATVVDGETGLLHQLPRASNVLTFRAHQLLHRFPGRGETDWVALGSPLNEEQRVAIARDTGLSTDIGSRPARLEPGDGPLLEALALDGRASWATLGKVSGLSERQVAHRVTALLAADEIYFYLDVADEAVGIRALATLWFAVAPADLTRAGAQLANHAEVSFVAAVTGATSLMAAVRCRDTPAFYQYLTTKVAAVEGLGNVEAVPMLTQLKQSLFLIENGHVREPPRLG